VGLERAVALEQRRAEPLVAAGVGDELEEQAVPLGVRGQMGLEVRCAAPGLDLRVLVGLDDGVHLGRALGEALVEHGQEEVLLGGEVRVEGALGEAGGPGDLVDGGVAEPAAGEDLPGRGEQPRPRLGTARHGSGRAVEDDLGPSRGASMIARRCTRSGRSGRDARSPEERARTLRTVCISNCAKLAPRQRRMPPPKGIQVYVPGWVSRKRSGRKAVGSG
jgi:hypothetical protein